MLVGQCMPASCSKDAVKMLLDGAEEMASTAAALAGIDAKITTLYVRAVPGSYSLMADPKMHILG